MTESATREIETRLHLIWTKTHRKAGYTELRMCVFFTDISAHLQPSQAVPMPMPQRETGSFVVTSYKTDIHIAMCSRLFGHAMPTAMNTKAKKMHASAPDHL